MISFPTASNLRGMADKLLLVLWEQRVEGGAERRRWLAYADLGNPGHLAQSPVRE